MAGSISENERQSAVKLDKSNRYEGEDLRKGVLGVGKKLVDDGMEVVLKLKILLVDGHLGQDVFKQNVHFA